MGINRHPVVSQQPEPEPERRGAVFETRHNMRCISEPDPNGGAPRGSIDLTALNYSDMADWEQAARVMDVAATVDSAVVKLEELMAQVVGEELRDADAELAGVREDFNAKVDKLQRENRDLRGALAEMRGQIAALLEMQSDLEGKLAARSSGAAQTPLAKPRIRLRTKRNQAAPVLAS
jgi:BMFP domain-containing protein YqiC